MPTQLPGRPLSALITSAGLATGVVLLSVISIAAESTQTEVQRRLQLGENPFPLHLRRPRTAPLSAVAQIGKRIFFDPSLSASGSLSCSSCHSPSHLYWADRLSVSRIRRPQYVSARHARRSVPYVSGTPTGIQRRSGQRRKRRRHLGANGCPSTGHAACGQEGRQCRPGRRQSGSTRRSVLGRPRRYPARPSDRAYA